jgi:hypothetical protein
LNKQLLEEQTRTVALEEEKKRPLNVHRWLALETTGICGSFTEECRGNLVVVFVSKAIKLPSSASSNAAEKMIKIEG